MYKILIVEDEEIIRKGIIYTVDWVKYNCVVVEDAADGKEGLEKIAYYRPDIVITDIKIPYINGLEMLQKSIKQYHYEAILVTGYEVFSYAKQAISLGVSEYLLKPIDLEELGKVLERLTEKIRKNQIYQEITKQSNKIQNNQIVDPKRLTALKSKYVYTMIKYIEQHYSEKISIKDIGAEFNLSKTYLNARFKEETGYPFNDFLNRYRISRSVELLKQHKLKVYEVALSVGIPDYKYFSLVFKKYVGCSPMQFVSSLE
ncbi:MAG: response regulator [Sphaerochaetaceae bacterium]